MSETLIFEKVVDKSALLQGITIPVAYHETLYSYLNCRLEHGQSMPIQIVMNNVPYTAHLKNQGFDTKKYSSHGDVLQIWYSQKSPFAGALQSVFHQTKQKIEEQAVKSELGSGLLFLQKSRST